MNESCKDCKYWEFGHEIIINKMPIQIGNCKLRESSTDEFYNCDQWEYKFEEKED